MSTVHMHAIRHRLDPTPLSGRSWLLRVVGLGFPVMRGTGLFNTRIGLLPKQARHSPGRSVGSHTAICSTCTALQHCCSDRSVVACSFGMLLLAGLAVPQEPTQPVCLAALASGIKNTLSHVTMELLVYIS